MSYPNMDYCKWENTALAMEQCLSSEEDLARNYTDPDIVDDHEAMGMRSCLRAAYKMLQLADPDLLRAMDLPTDLSRDNPPEKVYTLSYISLYLRYIVEEPRELAEMLQRLNNKGEEEYITTEFLREHEEGSEYSVMIDAAIRTGLLKGETVTERGLEFIRRFA